MNPSNAPIYAAPSSVRVPELPPPLPAATESVELLRVLVELQKEQLGLARQAAANADAQARWRAFLGRWKDEFPDIGPACKQVLPAVERAYLRLLTELTDRLRGDDPEDLDNEFTLNEFLDRYGTRLNQLGTVVSQLSPLSDASSGQ